MLWKRTIALLTVALAVSCTCGKSTSKEHVGPEATRPALDLKPLPTAPEMSAPQEPLPGAEALAVVAARPQGLIRAEIRPTITFSKPVRSLAQIEDQNAQAKAAPVAQLDPPLEGEWHWLGSASVEFVPSKLVPLSTRFKVTVAQGLKALDGTALKDDYTFTFDTPPLELQDVGPFRGFAWLKPDDEIRLLFNQPVADGELEAHAAFRVEGEPQPVKLKVVKRTSIEEEKRAEVEAARKAGKRPPADYEPLSDDQRGYRNQQTRYTLKPEKPFPLGRSITLELADGLHGEQGSAPMTPTEAPVWHTYGPLQINDVLFCGSASGCSYGPMTIETSNEVNLESVKTRLTISPAVEINWDLSSSWAPTAQYEGDRPPNLSLTGNFKPGVQYKVTVAAGVTDVFDQTTDKAFDGAQRTNDLEPGLETGPYMGLIEAAPNAAPKLPVEVANLKTLDVRMWNITQPSELVTAFLETGGPGWPKRVPMIFNEKRRR